MTPLLGPDTLDPQALDRLLEHIISAGIRGVFLLGTTGEGPALSARLKRQTIEQACRTVAGRIPVLVGITDSSYEDSVDLARFAAVQGADAVVSAGPLYFSVPPQLLVRFIARLAGDSPLPVFLYNMPSCTGVSFDVGTVVQSAGILNVAGIKDSSGSLGTMHQLKRALTGRDNFSVLIGPEELTAEWVLLGGHGGVNGGSNLWPRMYVALYEAAARGDLATIAKLQPVVVEVCGRIFEYNSYGDHFLEGLKYAASLLGLCGDFVGMPYGKLSNDGRVKIEQAVRELSAKVSALGLA
jgi:4-hydroxy-tetrahydrodipicolinate synthase